MSLYITSPYQWALDAGKSDVLLMGGALYQGQSTFLPTGSRVSVSSVDGLDVPDLNTVTDNYSNADGATVTADFHGPRTVAISGRVYTNPEAYWEDMAFLRSFWTSMRRSSTQQAILEFQLGDAAPAQIVTGKPTSLRYATTNTETAVGIVDFLGTIVCGDPRIYASAVSQPSGFTVGGSTLFPSPTLYPATNLYPAGLVTGGTAFPLTFPFQFSLGGTSGGATVINNGNYWAPTVMTLPGPLVNPKILNSTTGVSQQILMSIPAGSVVTIDSAQRTIMMGNYTAYAFMSAESDFIELAPGPNTLSLSVESGTGTGTISYRDTWM